MITYILVKILNCYTNFSLVILLSFYGQLLKPRLNLLQPLVTFIKLKTSVFLL